MFHLYPENIESLNDLQLVELLSVLLQIEAKNLAISANVPHVPFNINTPDGGEDGRIEVPNGTSSDFLFSGINLFQVKATEMEPESCYKEVLKEDKKEIKPNVKNVLDQGGTYILFYKYMLVTGGVERTTYGTTAKKAGQIKITYTGIQGRIQKIREAIQGIDPNYKNAKIEIYDANKVCTWANKYISAITFVLSCIGKPLPYGLKIWEEWAKQEEFIKFTYVQNETLKKYIETINNSVKNCQRAIRIVGESGLGKTRLVFEAFRKKDAKTCVYINANDANDLIAAINSWQRQALEGVLVVDDCPKELHERLRQEILMRGNKLKLITIGHDCDETLEDELIKITPSTQDVIEKIIIQSSKPDYVQLNNQDISKIVQLAEGYPKIAELIADAYIAVSDLRYLSTSRLLEKILWGSLKPNTKVYEILRGFALFSEIGIKDEFCNQYQFICEEICHVDKYQGYGLAKRYFSERGILVEYGRFAKLAPKPLALRLATEWWKERHPDEIKDIFNKLISGNGQFNRDNDLLEKFFHRMADIAFLPQVKGFVNSVVNGYLQKSDIIENGVGLNLLRLLIPIDAELVFSLVNDFFSNPQRRASLSLEYQQKKLDEELSMHLQKAIEGTLLKDRPLEYGSSIFGDVFNDFLLRLIGILKELAANKTSFQKVGKLLFKLSLDRDEKIKIAAKQIFLPLFKIDAETEAEPSERLTLLESLQDESNEPGELLIIEALSEVLTREQNKPSIPEASGSSRPKTYWQPIIDATQINEHASKVLSKLFSYSKLKRFIGIKASKILAQNISILIQKGYLLFIEKGLKTLKTKYWREGLTALLESYFECKKSSDKYEPSDLEKIKQLISLLIPTTTQEHLDFYIFCKLSIDWEPSITNLSEFCFDFTKLLVLIDKLEIERYDWQENKKFLFKEIVKTFPSQIEFNKLLQILDQMKLLNIHKLNFPPTCLYDLFDGIIDTIQDDISKINSVLDLTFELVKEGKEVFCFTKYVIEKLYFSNKEKIKKFLFKLLENNFYQYFIGMIEIIGVDDQVADKIFELVTKGKLYVGVLSCFSRLRSLGISYDRLLFILNSLQSTRNNENLLAAIDILTLYPRDKFTNELMLIKSNLLLSYDLLHEKHDSTSLDEWKKKFKQYISESHEPIFLDRFFHKVIDVIKLNHAIFSALINLILEFYQVQSKPTLEYIKNIVRFINTSISCSNQRLYTFGKCDNLLDKITYEDMVDWCKQDEKASILLVSRINLLKDNLSNRSGTFFNPVPALNTCIYSWNRIALYLFENHWTKELAECIDENINSSSSWSGDNGQLLMLTNKKNLFEELLKNENEELILWARKNIDKIDNLIKKVQTLNQEDNVRNNFVPFDDITDIDAIKPYGSRKRKACEEVENPSQEKKLKKSGFENIEPIDFSYWQTIPFESSNNGEKINACLSENLLKRGQATSEGNNCLLDCYFQQINDFLKNERNIEIPKEKFMDFVKFIRTNIRKFNNEMLSANDERESISILQAIKQYIFNEQHINVDFDLQILVADKDGDVMLVDNLDQLHAQINNHAEIKIPIRFIQINYNHYEPLFVVENNVNLDKHIQPMDIDEYLSTSNDDSVSRYRCS